MWVKICANTNLDDALAAAELGADAVGFVFAPSVRQVSVDQVARITPHLPPGVERVGVFAAFPERELEAVAQTVEQAGLSAVQMHGALDVKLLRLLGERLGSGVAVIPTAHWVVGEDDAPEQGVLATLAAVAAEERRYRVLVDSKVGKRSGGLGMAFQWDEAREAFRSQPRLRLILAGGLTPGNVAEAIRVLGPWGVDVASGVEREPGYKDRTRLKEFIEAARGAPRRLDPPAV